jgi:hypothetical protein
VTYLESHVQERIQEKGHMICDEDAEILKELSCLRMRCGTLEEREGIADAVGYTCCELQRGKH